MRVRVSALATPTEIKTEFYNNKRDVGRRSALRVRRLETKPELKTYQVVRD